MKFCINCKSIMHHENGKFICKKCGFDKAQIVERQPYISDEDTLIYLKCGKCGYSENLSKKIM